MCSVGQVWVNFETIYWPISCALRTCSAKIRSNDSWVRGTGPLTPGGYGVKSLVVQSAGALPLVPTHPFFSLKFILNLDLRVPKFDIPHSGIHFSPTDPISVLLVAFLFHKITFFEFGGALKSCRCENSPNVKAGSKEDPT